MVNYCKIIAGMRNFGEIFETRKQSFICAFSTYMTVPLSQNHLPTHTITPTICYLRL